jgi:hypothetical protein
MRSPRIRRAIVAVIVVALLGGAGFVTSAAWMNRPGRTETMTP